MSVANNLTRNEEIARAQSGANIAGALCHVFGAVAGVGALMMMAPSETATHKIGTFVTGAAVVGMVVAIVVGNEYKRNFHDALNARM